MSISYMQMHDFWFQTPLLAIFWQYTSSQLYHVFLFPLPSITWPSSALYPLLRDRRIFFHFVIRCPLTIRIILIGTVLTRALYFSPAPLPFRLPSLFPQCSLYRLLLLPLLPFLFFSHLSDQRTLRPDFVPIPVKGEGNWYYHHLQQPQQRSRPIWTKSLIQSRPSKRECAAHERSHNGVSCHGACGVDAVAVNEIVRCIDEHRTISEAKRYACCDGDDGIDRRRIACPGEPQFSDRNAWSWLAWFCRKVACERIEENLQTAAMHTMLIMDSGGTSPVSGSGL